MPSASQAADSGGTAARFTSSMVKAGTELVVATELERRIEIIEHEEMGDPSRMLLSGREIAVYIGVTVLAVVIGALVVAL